jgi:hypothetical protein
MAVAASRVAEALRAADIPEERRGVARVSQLSQAERGFYFWILRQFAAAAPPSADATSAAAVALGLDPGAATAVLARDDLVHTDSDGQPTVAYPFSASERGHAVLIDGRHEVQAMCAIDALAIAPMLNLPTTIVAHDSISGTEIRVQVDPDIEATWQPHGAVVLAGSTCCDGPSFRGCCDVLNFFETQETAERYLRDHPEITGTSISIPGAIEAGRLVFGDLLKENWPTGIDRSRVQELVVAGAQVVEVLPRDEYEDEHLPGAINIPLKELNPETAQQLARSRAVIVYCYDDQ